MLLTEWSLPITKDAIKYPLEMLLTIPSKEHNGKAEMTLRHMGVSAGADSKGADQSWNQLFDEREESPMEIST